MDHDRVAPAPAPPVATRLCASCQTALHRVESLPAVRRDRGDDTERDGCVVSKAARLNSGFRHFYMFYLAFAL